MNPSRRQPRAGRARAPRWVGLLLAMAPTGALAASPEPDRGEEPDGGLARTATAAVPVPDPGPVSTVEARRFAKRGRVHLRVGAEYFGREDFWISPGVAFGVGYAPWEWLGFELAGAVYFSTLDAAAEALRRDRGLLPDAEQPHGRVELGARWAFAYGKLLVEPTERLILHFDLGLSLRAGGLVTNRTFNPGGELALSVETGIGDRWLVWAEIGGWLGYEERRSANLHFGPRGGLGVGLRL